ncbi:MAG: hypothetical protein AAFS08_12135 [Pseudomonadota bacterium]
MTKTDRERFCARNGFVCKVEKSSFVSGKSKAFPSYFRHIKNVNSSGSNERETVFPLIADCARIAFSKENQACLAQRFFRAEVLKSMARVF